MGSILLILRALEHIQVFQNLDFVFVCVCVFEFFIPFGLDLKRKRRVSFDDVDHRSPLNEARAGGCECSRLALDSPISSE